MTGLSAALVALACAALIAPGPISARSRVRRLRSPGPATTTSRPRRRDRPRRDPWQEAGAWDELASCLRAGLSLDRAVRAVATSLPGPVADALTGVADLLALGADPADAWEPALEEPATARLARAARRSARSGAAVADVATTVAADVRAEAAEAVSARAERAGVLVAGPLGLCFLPAFLALGIAPVVIGLATPLLERT
ncbi:type II secretion system F family protein [Actinomycetospora sp. TBRC 11914]|uniref:type II secretion system F family protein n=1 Tax=Actinomycetospora sp. TBRC 11914 TaxID=2729387 RepID=UPI001B7D5A75|nr:type II secretion system F family protein [Actinomycetospora sp. TBRC 11914]